MRLACPQSTCITHRSMLDQIPYVVAQMRLSDITQVMEIEREAFAAPWPARAYRYEIAENNHSTMLVVKPMLGSPRRPLWLLGRLAPPKQGPVLGYAGCWHLGDEMHVSTIAVHAQWRGRGLGELLMLSLLEQGAARGALRATLEARVSNMAAQELYRKLGFATVGRQKRYYADNNEDAVIMATPSFDAPQFQANLRQCRSRLSARLRAQRDDVAQALRD